MIIAIDFDDTLMDTKNVLDGYKMGQPTPGAVGAVKALYAQGHSLYVLTASTNARRHSVSDWLAYFGFPPMRVTSEKTKADVYLDDRAIRFTSWDKAITDIEGVQHGKI